MTMAAEGTSPNDPESLAWHRVQLGALHLALGRVDDAAREYAHGDFVFPGHPLAVEGLARVDEARGRPDHAVARLEPLATAAPAPATLVYLAKLLRKIGRAADADRYSRLAEAAWRADAPEPARLAVFLADSGIPAKIEEAVRIAEAAAEERADIFTADALSWAYFRVGRLEDAAAASARATRTGSLDRTLREHAQAIARGLAR